MNIGQKNYFVLSAYFDFNVQIKKVDFLLAPLIFIYKLGTKFGITFLYMTLIY